jgi:hypothetical protein
MTRTCHSCGREFVPEHRFSHYCSDCIELEPKNRSHAKLNPTTKPGFEHQSRDRNKR